MSACVELQVEIVRASTKIMIEKMENKNERNTLCFKFKSIYMVEESRCGL